MTFWPDPAMASETDVGRVVMYGGPVCAVLVDLEGTLFANGGALP